MTQSIFYFQLTNGSKFCILIQICDGGVVRVVKKYPKFCVKLTKEAELAEKIIDNSVEFGQI